jgi:uncharacterized membrane protein
MNAVLEIEKTSSRISEEEKARRKKNIDYARGSVALEGVVLHPEIEVLNERYINGELTEEEYDEAIQESIYRRFHERQASGN